MKTVARNELIELVKQQLARLPLPKAANCPCSSLKQFFCKPFASWVLLTRRLRNPALNDAHEPIEPHEFESLAENWAQMRLSGEVTRRHCTGPKVCEYVLPCDGWDEWSDHDLARFLRELGGEQVNVDGYARASDGPQATT